MSEQTNQQQDFSVESIDKDALVKNYLELVEGKLQQEQIDSNVEAIKSMLSAQKEYKCDGEVVAAVFYAMVKVHVDKTPSNRGGNFTGHPGGIGIGAGKFWGKLYTNDLEKVYAETTSFAFTFTPTPIASAVYFHDKHNNTLGYVSCAGVMPILGGGSGSGKWKDVK